jgi:PilZ domain
VRLMEWEWLNQDSHESHRERAALLRSIPYEIMAQGGGGSSLVTEGKALTLNISSGGMLILMDQAPNVEQVLKIYVPTPVTIAETPTLAEVRWTRMLAFGRSQGCAATFCGD